MSPRCLPLGPVQRRTPGPFQSATAKQIYRPGLPRCACVPGSQLRLADSTGPGQHMAQHGRPAVGHPLVEGIADATALKALRLPRNNPHSTRPPHRRPSTWAYNDEISMTDSHTTVLAQNRGTYDDIRAGQRGTRRSQPQTGPGPGGFGGATFP
jgi:hypothetical protein